MWLTMTRIWLGLLCTSKLEYKQTVLNGKNGYITEVAKLSTGDLMLRVPHKNNLFMIMDKIPCERYYPMWLHKKDCEYNNDRGELVINKPIRDILTANMVDYMLGMTTSTNTDLWLIQQYDDKEFMHVMYLLFRDDPGMLRKYMDLGLEYAEQAVLESKHIQVDCVGAKLSRSSEYY